MKKILLLLPFISSLFAPSNKIESHLKSYLDEAGYKFVLEIEDDVYKREIGVKFSSINIIEKFTTNEKRFSFFINSYKGLLDYEGYRELVVYYSSSLGQKEFRYEILGAKKVINLEGDEKVDLVKGDDSLSFNFDFIVNDDFVVVKNTYMKLDGFLKVSSSINPKKFSYSYTYLDKEVELGVKYIKDVDSYVLTSDKVRFDDDSIKSISIKVKGEVSYKFEISYTYDLTFSSFDAFSHLEFIIL